MNGTVVYGDILFIINFSMDFLLLFCVSRIMHIKQKPALLVLSSAIGGAYAVAALFIENNVISVICNIAMSFLMCFIALPGVRGIRFFKSSALFYGLSMLLGGGITAMYVLLNKLGRGVNVNSDVSPVLSDIPLWVFCLLGVISAAASFITGKLFGRQTEKRAVDVKISGNEGCISVKCMVDSGALLREPISGAPVIILRLDCVKPCISGELYDAVSDGTGTKTAPGMRFIPTSGVGGKRLLSGFLPDNVSIGGVTKRAVIAVTGDTELGEFDGIVPAALCD